VLECRICRGHQFEAEMRTTLLALHPDAIVVSAESGAVTQESPVAAR
jgi:hypothetical protein